MAETIITVVFEVVKSQISYLCSYSNNFENLKNEIEKLKDESARVQHKVGEAKGRGKNILEKVENWFASVNEVIAKAEELVINEDAANNRCFMGLCPNLLTRLQLSKEAVKQLQSISKLREEGRFDSISYRSVPEDTWLLSKNDYEAFGSRKSTLENMLSALKDPDVNMLGIYGMGGIGKTTLVKEVARQAKCDKLFDQVVFAEVSQSPNIRKIQGEIADKLGLIFHEESESGRARSLCNRLKTEKRILVILDNIWEYLDLQVVGIPCKDDHKGCKVLLTARNEDVLPRKVRSQQNFSVGVLKEDEAWSLLKKKAGEYIEESEFKSTAMEVARECAGLPVSIVTVARALIDKRLFEWEDALIQLRKPSSANFKNIQSEAYLAIELSYNNLKTDELKKIFLLIGYAHVTNVNDLLMYAMGLRLLEGINLMEEAQVRVRTLVQRLKASCLLLGDESENEERWFSMHDVIRYVAIAIAKEQNEFTMTNDELVNRWKLLDESTIKSYTSLVLKGVQADVLPEKLECPQLKLVIIIGGYYSSLPDNFFTRMTEVKVLDLTYMRLLPLPSSICLLRDLRVLCLDHCALQDISIIGDLKNLEIFSLRRAARIKQLPVEIGQLALLRVLNLSGCRKLKVIPPNVLSQLSNLEELYIFHFKQWEVEVKEQKNASLDELQHLPNLTSLELCIPDANILPRGLFFEKLKRNKICIGVAMLKSSLFILDEVSREFLFRVNTNIGLKDGLIMPLKGIECLCLFGLQDQDIKNFIYELVKMDSFQLKHLEIKGCGAPNPEESKRLKDLTSDIWSNESIDGDDSFFHEKVALPNLETLLLGCNGLIKLLTFSTAKFLVRLRKMEMNSCNMITEIVADDEGDNGARDEIIFRELKMLQLYKLNSLTSFYSSNCAFKFPSLETLYLIKCPNMKIFSGGELSTPKLHQAKLHWNDKKYWIWERDLNTTIQQQYLKTKRID